MAADEGAVTVPRFAALKGEGRKIAMVTAYDFAFARMVDAAGVDGILVGDSLGMVVQGRANTLPVTLDQMIYHAEMVGRAVEHALVIVDLPFPYQLLGVTRAVEAAARVLKETRCQAVKLEGGVEQSEVVAALVAGGVPVMGHCGLRPQSVHAMGGYTVQRDRERLLADALALERAGAFAVVLECIPAPIAVEITAAVRIPTIGIGAGRGCDGQVLVLHDLLGLTQGHLPRHVKCYADLGSQVSEAVARYRDEVREGRFPTDDQAFK